MNALKLDSAARDLADLFKVLTIASAFALVCTFGIAYWIFSL